MKFLSSNVFIMNMISANYISNFTYFYAIVSFFLTKLLTLAILFSTAVRAVVVAKLVVLSILFLISFMLTLRAVVVAKLSILGISVLTYLF